jgi:hypothetical protein
VKAQPLKKEEKGCVACEPDEATHLFICLPIVGSLLLPIVTGSKSRRDIPGAVWTWNKDTEKPTLKPSILNDPFSNGEIQGRNHCFLNDGMVRFLNDCTHELKGQTVETEDVDADFFRVDDE